MKSFFGEVSPNYLKKAADIFSTVKRSSYIKMDIGQGNIVLDLGCGPGIDIMALTEFVGVKGKIFGFDHDGNMLQEAKNVIQQSFSNYDIELVQGNADHLPFNDNFFSSCRSERLFMHLFYPEQTLAEIFRVLKPGGKAVIIDTDWSSLTIDNPYPRVERILSDFRISQVLNNGYSGRSLFRQMNQQNFCNLKIEIFPICITDLELYYYLSMQHAVENQALQSRTVSKQEINEWRAALEQASNNEHFYSSVNLIMISGEKPG